MSEEQGPTRFSWIGGVAVFGSLGVGIFGAVVAANQFYSFKQDSTGVGACLIAAALAFGLLANSIYRR